jgi:non-heme chloroperoxidase
VRIGASAKAVVKIAPKAELKIYPGAPHGLPTIHKSQGDADLVVFLVVFLKDSAASNLKRL